MEPVKISEIVKWCDGKIDGNFKDILCYGISTDTRNIKKGDLFVALKGERFDGHDFVKDAFRKGAIAVIVRKDFSFERGTLIKVNDTLKALGEIAKGYRKKFNPYIIGITGSDGKTTTKEILKKTLGIKFKVVANKGNYNNEIGLPLSIFQMERNSEFCVFEMGMNRKGEIFYLSEIAQPSSAVITNIGKAHIGFFKSMREIAEAKSEIFENLKGERFSLLNYDDKFFKFLRSKTEGPVESFGIKKGADVRGVIIEEGDFYFKFRVEGIEPEFKMNFWNTSLIYPGLVSIGFAKKFNINMEKVREIIEEVTPLEGRGKVYKLKNFVVIDETYNSNPNSLKNSLIQFNKKSFKRKVAIIGDMAELGKFSKFFHRNIGELIKKLDISLVITFGRESRIISEVVGRRAKHFNFPEEVNSYLERNLKKGDGILIKGSRVMKMERIVKFIVENLGG